MVGYFSMNNIDNDGRRVSLSFLGLNVYLLHTSTHMWAHMYVGTHIAHIPQTDIKYRPPKTKYLQVLKHTRMPSIKDYVECWGLGGTFSGHPKQRVGFREWQKSDHLQIQSVSQDLKICPNFH